MSTHSPGKEARPNGKEIIQSHKPTLNNQQTIDLSSGSRKKKIVQTIILYMGFFILVKQ